MERAAVVICLDTLTAEPPSSGTECPTGDANADAVGISPRHAEKASDNRHNPDYPILIGIGVSERTAGEWIATYGTARVGQSLRYLRQYQAQGRKVPSPAGFVRRSLERGWGMKLLSATPEEIAARHRKAREACYVPVSALREASAQFYTGDAPPMEFLRGTLKVVGVSASVSGL